MWRTGRAAGAGSPNVARSGRRSFHLLRASIACTAICACFVTRSARRSSVVVSTLTGEEEVVQIGTHDRQPGQDGLPAEDTGGTPQSAADDESIAKVRGTQDGSGASEPGFVGADRQDQPSAPAAAPGTPSSLSPSRSLSPDGPVASASSSGGPN